MAKYCLRELWLIWYTFEPGQDFLNLAENRWRRDAVPEEFHLSPPETWGLGLSPSLSWIECDPPSSGRSVDLSFDARSGKASASAKMEIRNIYLLKHETDGVSVHVRVQPAKENIRIIKPNPTSADSTASGVVLRTLGPLVDRKRLTPIFRPIQHAILAAVGAMPMPIPGNAHPLALFVLTAEPEDRPKGPRKTDNAEAIQNSLIQLCYALEQLLTEEAEVIASLREGVTFDWDVLNLGTIKPGSKNIEPVHLLFAARYQYGEREKDSVTVRTWLGPATAGAIYRPSNAETFDPWGEASGNQNVREYHRVVIGRLHLILTQLAMHRGAMLWALQTLDGLWRRVPEPSLAEMREVLTRCERFVRSDQDVCFNSSFSVAGFPEEEKEELRELSQVLGERIQLGWQRLNNALLRALLADVTARRGK